MAEKAKAIRSPMQQPQSPQPTLVQPSNVERYSLLSGGDQRASSPPLVPKPLSVVLSLCFLLFFFLKFAFNFSYSLLYLVAVRHSISHGQLKKPDGIFWKNELNSVESRIESVAQSNAIHFS